MTEEFKTLELHSGDPIVHSGFGIPSDKSDFIFEKFTKLDMFTEGLGLGLFLCRRVVQFMGGSLTLDLS